MRLPHECSRVSFPFRSHSQAGGWRKRPSGWRNQAARGPRGRAGGEARAMQHGERNGQAGTLHVCDALQASHRRRNQLKTSPTSTVSGDAWRAGTCTFLPPFLDRCINYQWLFIFFDPLFTLFFFVSCQCFHFPHHTLFTAIWCSFSNQKPLCVKA